MRRVARQIWKTPTCKNEAEISLLLSVIIIIIITTYISNIYYVDTWFPRPMVEYKFNNNYDVILCAFALLLEHFEKEEQLFAIQCI